MASSQCDAFRTRGAGLHVLTVMVRFARCEKSSSLPSTCWSPLRSSRGLRAVAAESLLLKHQLLISNRSRQRAPNLTSVDRLVLGFATLFVRPHRLPKLGALVTPATLLKFHGALVERKYRRLFSSSASPRRKPGPKGPSAEVIAAIVALKRRNPHFGCVRIAQQITRAFGVEIDKDVVRRVLAKHYRPGDSGTTGPSAKLIAQAKDSLWSVDLFRCESILLHSHWVLVVIDVFTRRIVGFGIERASIDGLSVCRMFNHAVAGRPPPKHVSADHDPLFRFHRWRANLRVREIGEVKSVPYAPVSHPFVERLIGTIRREPSTAQSGTRWIYRESWRHSRITTTAIACIAGSRASRQRSAPARSPAPAAGGEPGYHRSTECCAVRSVRWRT